MNAPLTRAAFDEAVPADDQGAAAFKAAMRHLVGGVSIVTVAHGADRGGLTVTSLVSLSAEPPSLLFSVKQDASSLPLLRASGRFAVNILGHGHQAIADRFAGRDGRRGADRFSGAPWIGKAGAPHVLADALAVLECTVSETLDRFSHTIVIGRVVESRFEDVENRGALVYWRAAYDGVGHRDGSGDS